MELVRLTVVLNEIEADQIQSLLKFEDIESMQRPTDVGAGEHRRQRRDERLAGDPRQSEDLETARAIIGEG